MGSADFSNLVFRQGLALVVWGAPLIQSCLLKPQHHFR
jgi:hypothetical protein